MAISEPQHVAAPAATSSHSRSLRAETIYEQALWYHSLGFNVVPLERPEKGKLKKPTCQWKDLQTTRQHRRELVALHTRTTKDHEPHWAYGVQAVDGINDLRHLDLDKVTSSQVIETILTTLGLPLDYPWVVQSGSGQGYHLCFRCQGDVTQLLPGHQGESPKAVYFGDAKDQTLFDHLELRWHAAVTTLPPSAHWSGGRYSFVNDKPKAPPPYVPLERVIAAFHQVATPKSKERPPHPEADEKVTSLEQFRASRPHDGHRAEERWAQKALDEELWQLAKARNGNRNEHLNRAAFALGQIVAGGLLSETEVTTRLTTIARQIGLTDQEIAPTIGSGLAAGKQHPRTPTPLTFPATRATPSSGGTAPQSAPRGKPLILINGRQEHEIVEDALDALVAANTPPSLFVRSGKLVRVKVDERGQAHIEQVTEAMLRLRLTEVAEWAKFDAKGEIRHASPMIHIVQDILAAHTWPFPSLEGITEIPLVRPDGSLLVTPGYDPPTGMVYAPSKSLHLSPIPDMPTQAQAEQALQRIWAIIGEFPYVGLADRANTLGLMLTPFLRHAFGGHVPMALVDAPKQGTGKGLLTGIFAILATGQTACPLQESKDDEEWRKAITSTLLRGTSLIVIDNLDRTLKSGRLSSALTLHTWGDRLLSKNEMISIPFKVTWIANGNNIRLGGDMGSRCYRIRLDARVSNPAARDHFTIKDLEHYVSEHRGEIIADLLTIVRYWYSSGKPLMVLPRMRSFSEWATMIGSILHHVGIHEFLANLEQMKAEANEQDNQWFIFFQAWSDVIEEEWISTKALAARMTSADPEATTHLAECLPDFLAEARADKPATFVVRLGQALRGHVETCYGKDNLRLERETDSHTGQPRWRVVCQGSRSAPKPLPLFATPVEPINFFAAGVAGVDSPSQVEKNESDQSSLLQICQIAKVTPAPPAGQERDEHEGPSEAVSLPLAEQASSPQSPAPPSAGEPATLSKIEVWDLVHQRLVGVKRVITPRGAGTVWRNWFGDVGVTLDEERCSVQFKDIAGLLAIEPFAEDSVIPLD